MRARVVALACALALAPSAARAQARDDAGAPAAPLRAVFHLSEGSPAAVERGLLNATNALRALGAEPAQIVLVVHGPAMRWFVRREPRNVGALLAALLATGRAEWRACARTLAERGWTPAALLPGARVVPSGTLEVLRLQQGGYVYFRP